MVEGRQDFDESHPKSGARVQMLHHQRFKAAVSEEHSRALVFGVLSVPLTCSV